MSKLKIASLALLLAGATALPAQADDDRRRVGGEAAAQADGGKGAWREERRDERGDRREDRREDRGERREDRRDWRAERRDDRRDDRREWVADRRDDRRDDRREWRDDRRDGRREWREDRRDDRRDWDRGWDRADPRVAYRHDYRHDYRGDWRDDRREWRDVRYARHRDQRWDRWYWAPQYRYTAPYRYYYPRGYGYRAWHVGHRLPSPFYARNYWVDYRYYRLPPPPHGYHWVRVDRDVVLVAIGTGLILDVFYGLFH